MTFNANGFFSDSRGQGGFEERNSAFRGRPEVSILSERPERISYSKRIASLRHQPRLKTLLDLSFTGGWLEGFEASFLGQLTSMRKPAKPRARKAPETMRLAGTLRKNHQARSPELAPPRRASLLNGRVLEHETDKLMLLAIEEVAT
jgi:hypothetical protein